MHVPQSLVAGTHLSGLLPSNLPRQRARWRCRHDSRRCAVHLMPPLRHSIGCLCAYRLEPSCPVSCRRRVASLRYATTAHPRCCARDADAKRPATRPCAMWHYALARLCALHDHLPSTSLSSSAPNANVRTNFSPRMPFTWRTVPLCLQHAPPEHMKSAACTTRACPATRAQLCPKYHPVLFHSPCVCATMKETLPRCISSAPRSSCPLW
jgi:hypothetical protein